MLNRLRMMAIGVVVLALPASAAAFPEKPVTLVVPFGTGSGSDVMGRALAGKLSEIWGQRLLVENRPGAATTLGAAHAAKLPPDGYSLLLAPPPWLITQYVFDKLSYTTDSFDPISLVAIYPMVFVVPKDSKFTSLKQLVEHARTGGSVSYASVGPGSTPHLMGEMLAGQQKLKLVHVPYGSGGQATVDLIAGRTDFYGGHPTEVLNHVKAGSLRALAVLAPERLKALPDVPTSSEAGFPDLQIFSWTTIVAPKGTPKTIRDKISADIKTAMEDEKFTSTFQQNGAVFIGSTPEELATFYEGEHKKFGPLVKSIGIKPVSR